MSSVNIEEYLNMNSQKSEEGLQNTTSAEEQIKREVEFCKKFQESGFGQSLSTDNEFPPKFFKINKNNQMTKEELGNTP